MKKYFLLLSGLLLLFFSFTQKEDAKWLTYQLAIQNEPEPTQKVENILDLAFYALNYYPDSTMKYAALAYDLAQKNDYIKGMISAEMVRGYHVRNQGQYEEAISHFNKAIDLNEPLNNVLRKAQLDDNISNVYLLQGKLDEAISIKESCIKIFKTENDTPSIYIGLNGIGSLLNDKEDYLGAAKYFEESLLYATNAADFAYAYGNLGISYRHRNMPDSAIYYYQKGIELMDDEPRYLTRSYLNIGILQKSNGQFLDALNAYDKAEIYAQKIQDKNFLAVIQMSKAFVHDELGAYTDAQKYIDKAQPTIESYGELSSKRDLKKIQYLVAEHTGNYKNANDYYKSFIALRDSVNNLELDSRLAEFETKYETAEKEKVIANQKVELQKKKIQRNILLASLGAAIWLGLFIGLYFWNRNRLNKIISAQDRELKDRKISELEQEKKLLSVAAMLEGQENERMRIAQDLHDSIGGLLTSVKAHFGVIQKEIKKLEEIDLTGKVNELIDEASTEVRRISHNMAPRVLKLYGLKSAIEDLTQQLHTDGGLQVDFEWNGDDIIDLKLGDTKEVMLYRIVQEALNNIVKHAQAKNVIVQINAFENELNLMIEDDGIGFNVQKALINKSLGLKSIQSRVDYLDGKLDIDARPGEGTTISIQIKS